MDTAAAATAPVPEPAGRIDRPARPGPDRLGRARPGRARRDETGRARRALPGSRHAAVAPERSSLKILILALNSAPDLVGAGKVTGEMADWLAARGHRVEVVAAPPFYPGWRVADGYSPGAYRRDNQGAVGVLRCPTYVPRRPTGARRVLHHLSFAVSSLPAVVGARSRAGRTSC
ncbi:MAG: glycosyltransferase [Rhodovibrio sp.]|nr:glycosyltransferase [Rhodovibrio sp.]